VHEAKLKLPGSIYSYKQINNIHKSKPEKNKVWFKNLLIHPPRYVLGLFKFHDVDNAIVFGATTFVFTKKIITSSPTLYARFYSHNNVNNVQHITNQYQQIHIKFKNKRILQRRMQILYWIYWTQDMSKAHLKSMKGSSMTSPSQFQTLVALLRSCSWHSIFTSDDDSARSSPLLPANSSNVDVGRKRNRDTRNVWINGKSNWHNNKIIHWRLFIITPLTISLFYGAAHWASYRSSPQRWLWHIKPS